MKIRLENASDLEAIRDVVTLAFGQTLEATLVDRLRSDGDLVVSLVAEGEGRLVGYLALSQLKSPNRALALAPVAVVPGMQRQGVASALIRAALQEAYRYGSVIVFVLGDPRFYCRFGFSAATAADNSSAYAGPHFMAVRLGNQQLVGPEPVIYAPAFEVVERVRPTQRA